MFFVDEFALSEREAKQLRARATQFILGLDKSGLLLLTKVLWLSLELRSGDREILDRAIEYRAQELGISDESYEMAWLLSYLLESAIVRAPKHVDLSAISEPCDPELRAYLEEHSKTWHNSQSQTQEN